eukprot:6367184-Amphidinium_carterae.1
MQHQVQLTYHNHSNAKQKSCCKSHLIPTLELPSMSRLSLLFVLAASPCQSASRKMPVTNLARLSADMSPPQYHTSKEVAQLTSTTRLETISHSDKNKTLLVMGAEVRHCRVLADVECASQTPA